MRLRGDDTRLWLPGGEHPTTKRPRLHHAAISGATAVAVHGDRALMLGGFNEHRSRACLVHLAEGRDAPLLSTHTLVAPDGTPWTERCVGVRDQVWSARGRVIYRLTAW